ncbi:hypothetical protein Veis_3134 [Verminephrobacter eiseniae EF01-2]|uniref:DarT domain-containing protein n=1 Tax=Verminephrobacter eiseniae (strain EF01-2) TaxID=391735 RepID=A1WMK8_VEREI|nr:hypothetical protein Veis_3134 [Verminephrobacter eiseniae EF01-2]
MNTARYSNLNPEKALIWRIVHRDNLPWILRNGLYSKNSPKQDPRYVVVASRTIIWPLVKQMRVLLMPLLHRLTKPRTPRTNGMVERFNGRIADVLKTHRFDSREDMEQTLRAMWPCTTTNCRSQRWAARRLCRP